MAIAHLPPKSLRSRYLCIDHFNVKYVRNQAGQRKRLQRTAIPEQWQDPDTLQRLCTPPPVTKGPDTEKDIVQMKKVATTESVTAQLDNFEGEYLEEIVKDDSQQLPGKAADVSSNEFSWQRASAVVPCDADDEADAECPADAVMFEAAPQRLAKPVHEGFRCNCCSGSIVGFRYVCVQCADYDLCGACEAGGAHSEHYVLRVPGPRPYSEVAGVLHTIRRALLTDSILLVDGTQAEVKEEPDESDPISLEAELTESDGEDSEESLSSDELAGVDMPRSPRLENDDSKSSDESSCRDVAPEGQKTDNPNTDLNRLKANNNTNVIVVSATSKVSGAQVGLKSSTTSQDIKKTTSDTICYFDKRKNAIIVLGAINTDKPKPANLKRGHTVTQLTAPHQQGNLRKEEHAHGKCKVIRFKTTLQHVLPKTG